MNSIPFPVHAEIVETRGTKDARHPVKAKKT
ncbi:hypothetical protein [Microcoleus phage My-WqHQDG]|nr:hypothetical protein [Microcoleus phage My-WqHQDG]